MSHLFISYSRQNRLIVDQIVEALETDGYDCWIDRQDIQAARQWRIELMQAIEDCEVFVIGISKNSVTSEIVFEEVTHARSLGKPMVPLIIQQVELPERMAFLKDWQWVDLLEGYQQGLDKLKAAVPQVKQMATQLPPNNIPRSGALRFVGRKDALQEVHNQLQTQERVAICALSGMGGIGKTELAIQYAQRYWIEAYPGGVCWLRARDQEVAVQVIAFAITVLDLSIPEELTLEQQVQWCWHHWPQKELVLVVFDDVTGYPEIEKTLPPVGLPQFKVLMTTRLQRVSASVTSIPLELLSPHAARKLLTSFAGTQRIAAQTNVANALCEWLGYLPLGIELVGQYLRQRVDLSLGEMLKRLQSKRLDQRALQQLEGGTTAQLNVAAAFELSWQELSEEGQHLACLLSLFALAPIPWELVQFCQTDLDDEALEDLREEQLINNSLLRRVDSGVYQLHQLVREFLQVKRQGQDQDMVQQFCSGMVSVAQRVPNTPTKDEIAVLTPTIAHLGEVVQTHKDALNEEQLIWPYVGLGRFYEGQGLYAQALPWYQDCLEVCRQQLGEAHPGVATSLNNLAELYRSRGHYEDAEPLYIQSLELLKQQLGEAHPDVATSLNNLAELYRSQGHYEDAEPLYIQSLELLKQQLGEAHPHVATSLNNLALLYKMQGRYEDAKPVYIQSLELRKQLLGEAHPDVAQSLNNLAELYRSQGRYEDAEPLYIQSLELRKQLLGEAHPDVAQSLNNLAALYEGQGRYEEAESLYIQSLELRKQLLGEAHPDVAQSLNNLAALYEGQGRYEEAESLYIQSLELRKQLLGEAHPDFATSLNNLAELYKSQDRYEDAESLYLQATVLVAQSLDKNHPTTITILGNLYKLIATLINKGQERSLSKHPITQAIIHQIKTQA